MYGFTYGERRANSVRRNGFTLIELLVVIAIIALLASILFPVFARARENARRASCQSNEKQIGLGLLQYAQDFDEYLPASYNYLPFGSSAFSTGYSPIWADAIQPYIKSLQIFICPSAFNANIPAGAPLYTGVPSGTACRLSYGAAVLPGATGGAYGNSLPTGAFQDNYGVAGYSLTTFTLSLIHI